jgi:hypothetical protein
MAQPVGSKLQAVVYCLNSLLLVKASIVPKPLLSCIIHQPQLGLITIPICQEVESEINARSGCTKVDSASVAEISIDASLSNGISIHGKRVARAGSTTRDRLHTNHIRS